MQFIEHGELRLGVRKNKESGLLHFAQEYSPNIQLNLIGARSF